jgi:hypothetical protein
MIDSYYYSGQIRDYILQFCSVFTGLHVKTGNPEEFIPVPIVVGNKDRVVASIMSRNTQNLPISLPTMSAHMSNINPAPERYKGTGTVDERVFMPVGGVFPDDLRVVRRLMPIPYNMEMELSIYASNTQQRDQILEQILLLFSPTLQIQKNDAAFDWTKISQVELTGIANNENYPVGQDKRIINWDFNFTIPIYISAPLDIKDNVIKQIILRLGNLNGMDLNEYDEDGNLQPFKTLYSTTTIDS